MRKQLFGGTYNGVMLVRGLPCCGCFAPASRLGHRANNGPTCSRRSACLRRRRSTRNPRGQWASRWDRPKSQRPASARSILRKVRSRGCAGSGNAASTGALFDGGGMSGGSSIQLRRQPQRFVPASSTGTIGRVGIPLGATEIGGAGISPSVPVAGPGLLNGVTPNGTTSIDSPSNP